MTQANVPMIDAFAIAAAVYLPGAVLAGALAYMIELAERRPVEHGWVAVVSATVGWPFLVGKWFLMKLLHLD